MCRTGKDQYDVGMLAISKAGHDRNTVYMIIDADDAYVYLVDGRIRTLEKPKKKKRKHIQIIRKRHDIRGIDDAKIKRILKEWNKEEANQEDYICQRLT